MRNEVIFDDRGRPDILVVFTPDELKLPDTFSYAFPFAIPSVLTPGANSIQFGMQSPIAYRQFRYSSTLSRIWPIFSFFVFR